MPTTFIPNPEEIRNSILCEVLADNDALVKLVHCNLIDESLNAFHYDARFTVLPTFGNRAASMAKKRYSPEVAVNTAVINNPV